MVDIAAASADASWWETNDILALIIVTVGVVGEGIALWLPKERRETPYFHGLERRAWLFVVLGLLFEGVSQRNKDAADSIIVSSLNETAENERLARIKLEDQLAPRRLDEKAGAAIRDRLTAFSGMRLDMIVCGEPFDILEFSPQLYKSLTDAHWKVTPWTTIGNDLVVRGVAIETRSGSDQTIEFAADALIAVLNKHNITAARKPSFSTGEASS